MNAIPLQIAEFSRSRSSECSRIQVQQTSCVDRGIRPRDHIRPPYIAGCAAARRVDDAGETYRTYVGGHIDNGSGLILAHDIRPRDAHIDGKTASHIQDAANMPIGDKKV